jgi:hypothetical protein
LTVYSLGGLTQNKDTVGGLKCAEIRQYELTRNYILQAHLGSAVNLQQVVTSGRIFYESKCIIYRDKLSGIAQAVPQYNDSLCRGQFIQRAYYCGHVLAMNEASIALQRCPVKPINIAFSHNSLCFREYVQKF